MTEITQSNYPALRINGERLWNRLMEMARIGATPKGGVCRVALTDEDKAGRDRFVRWCQAAGCAVTVDRMGNIFARRAGLQDDLPPVLAGSHLDSQPTGGKFDGAYGVLAALEVIETLNDHNITTDAPLEIVSWTNEEGARFAPAMIASGVFAGVFDLDYGLSRTDKAGRTLGEELRRIGYAGDAPVGGRTFRAAFELHIEQGPILEAEGKQVGIVTGVQGMRWYHLHLTGKESHAGTTPMERRQDPVRALWPILRRVYALAAEHAPDVRLTMGDINAQPGVINTVPGQLRVTLDARHPHVGTLNVLDEALHAIVAEECAAAGVPGQLEAIWYSPPVAFADECIDAVRRAVETTGVAAREMISGAGHDAAYVARVAPTSLIFAPCEDGLSHNELENAQPADLEAGCNVLLHTVLDRANAAR